MGNLTPQLDSLLDDLQERLRASGDLKRVAARASLSLRTIYGVEASPRTTHLRTIRKLCQHFDQDT